jgi:hypothetical protein
MPTTSVPGPLGYLLEKGAAVTADVENAAVRLRHHTADLAEAPAVVDALDKVDLRPVS